MSAWEGLSPPYSTIVVDPPWHYDAVVVGHVGGRRGRWDHQPFPYSTLTVAEITALPVGDLAAEDCWCFLWTTNRYIRSAFDVLEAWKFTYRQTIVWHKVGKPSPFGPALAPNHAEFILVGVRGKPPVVERWPGSVVAHARPQRHSEKPSKFDDLIEAACPGPYVELFCRRPRFGWDSWGHGYESGVAS